MAPLGGPAPVVSALLRTVESVIDHALGAVVGALRDPALTRLGELDLDGTEAFVLYAPDGGRRPAGLDLEAVAAALGDGFVLLARDAGGGPPGGPVVDVSDVQDVAALLLLCDALVTDHAPLMFDYARLDRPMFFYVPELTAQARASGFVDLVREAPGPVLREPGALVAALREFRRIGPLYGPARRSFAARHCVSGRGVDGFAGARRG